MQRLAPLPAALRAQLDAASARLSRALHSLVFSFPSPSATASSSARNTTAAAAPKLPANVTDAVNSTDPLLSQPGEPRAWAGGVGPLSFAGSGYGVVLIIIAILLNRIHHIVQRPQHAPPAQRPAPGLRAALQIHFQHALTSPGIATAIRVPALLVLARAWALFTVLTMQVADVWPADVVARSAERIAGLPRLLMPAAAYGARAADRLGAWAGEKHMQSVCWTVFLCVCAALVCGALANGLDRGRRRDVGAGFNLFHFSFLLHLYSSPLTHHNPPPNANHGRPDIHALFQLWLGLTEFSWLQVNELSPVLRQNLLLPTGVCGVLGLVHFVHALTISPPSLPSLSFVTHLLALFLTIIISCTVVLKAFTHIFTLGYLPSPIWVNLLPNEGAVPSLEDDFGVALLKLGTACIEATSYSGLKNELAPVEEAQPWLELSPNGCDQVNPGSSVGGFGTAITDIHVAELRDPNADSPFSDALTNFWKAASALAYDMFLVVLSTPVGRKIFILTIRTWRARWWYGPRHWRFWRREAWAAPPPNPLHDGLIDVLMSSIVRGVQSREQRPFTAPVPRASRRPTPVPDQYTFDQVLRGEVVIEDDEDEWAAQTVVDEFDDDWESDAGGVSAPASDDEDDDQAGSLYRDLVVRDSTPDPDQSSLQPILLAHLTSTGSPLTRRRYAAILGSGGASGSASGPSTPTRPGAGSLHDVVLTRRTQASALATPQQQDEWADERRHTCVVCMVQPRDVILWPCRCLLMCNDCRDSLASRLAPTDHNCPNCRTKVDGFSRIYVP
ncbi:hypothetical protein Q8F55_001335 [Vanrija albida]|uniref:RING-type domain-containing protein n=1 Tax=Vanrija albida TaxID=181172 RepID=A0ABR3QFS1_9TREE